MIYTWKRQLAGIGDKAFPATENQQPELSQLKKENARLKEDVEILKKAAGIFLSRSGKDTQ